MHKIVELKYPNVKHSPTHLKVKRKSKVKHNFNKSNERNGYRVNKENKRATIFHSRLLWDALARNGKWKRKKNKTNMYVCIYKLLIQNKDKRCCRNPCWLVHSFARLWNQVRIIHHRKRPHPVSSLSQGVQGRRGDTPLSTATPKSIREELDDNQYTCIHEYPHT